jgi:hypothetical protein
VQPNASAEVEKMGPREPLTIRLPVALLERARAVKAQRESLNDLVVEAVEREVRRRRGLQAYEAILSMRKQIVDCTGLQPDSSALIRSLREGEGRRD